jgi:hypothetical protein
MATDSPVTACLLPVPVSRLINAGFDRRKIHFSVSDSKGEMFAPFRGEVVCQQREI